MERFADQKAIYIATTADFHIKEVSSDKDLSLSKVESILHSMASRSDAGVLCGDTFETGSLPEGRLLVPTLRKLTDSGWPLFFVPGNHDDNQELFDMLEGDTGITVLNGKVAEVKKGNHAVNIVGVKGYFDGTLAKKITKKQRKRVEKGKKRVVEHIVLLNEALLQAKNKAILVATHYSPTRETIKGETHFAYPFLGSTLLATVVDIYQDLDIVMAHGHAHHGSVLGKTPGGRDVYDVAWQVRRRRVRKGEIPELQDYYRVFHFPKNRR